MPRLLGKDKNSAASDLERAGLRGNPSETYSDRPVGEVISQSISYGHKVDKGTVIDYTVSKGPEPKKQVTIPTGLSGQLISSVKATLGNMGIKVDIEYAESTQYGDGYVISVPNEGQSVEVGTTIVVKVSTGPGPSMPNPNPEPDNGGDGDTTAP